MRLKVGFLLRSLLVIGTFLGLVVLWSSLSPKPTNENPFGKRDDSLLPKGDLGEQFKPVVPWPHVEGVEVDLNSIRHKHGEANHHQEPNQQPNQKQVIQQQYVTFRPHTQDYTSPVLKKGILGNFEPHEPEPPGVPGGPGEGAKPFVLGPEYKDSVHASIKEFGFNMVASDMISLDRTISDLRHEECKYWHYDDRLLTSSVVIVFHNEGWSTLMRTIHSVIKRTPRRYLAEIVMIDDYSNKVHLKERLEEYIKQWNGLVKLFRNEKREGLIQARSIGANKATKGQVLIYLDAHCEVGINWYAPLVAPISKDRTVCTVPLIDYIDGNEYTMEPQQGGDEDGLARGAWDWSLLWKRVPLSQREKAKRKHTTQPYWYIHFTASMLRLIPDLFVSPSPIPSPHLFDPTLCPALSRIATPPPCLCAVCISPSWSPSPQLFSPCMFCACPYIYCVRTVCTVPLIDSIHGQRFTIEAQGGGDGNGFARGAWDWSMLWKRVPLGDREKKLRKTQTEPYRSPAMAGGLFAIERDFFFELGLYDPGLQIWGGENFEISYKIWQCGGQLLFVPCSRVGHIYRLQGWQGNPPPAHVGSSPTLKNYVRVVEVWWDEYKDYFYASRPETLTLAYGDISDLKRFREEHRCKSFKWFMEEIAYDIPLHYPLPPKNVEWGEIRGFETSYCIDSMGHTNGGSVETGPCHRMGGNQLFRINEANQLMQYDQCLTRGDSSAVIITHCDQKQYTEWKYFKGNVSTALTCFTRCSYLSVTSLKPLRSGR
ncbi:N-acetylgalactosaminyltransferase 7 isoform X2 [Leuresthes tenuis]|uniref:N-acetylgalactosaminyltransferase 7 isoform X2 n=1 Tax=Leuresthes tenuis TaxID=355514 RepID=UPI003B509D3D